MSTVSDIACLHCVHPLFELRTCAVQDVYEISWRIDKVVGNITFTAKFTGMGDNGYFAFGLGQKMAGADIFAFITYEVKPTLLLNYLDALTLLLSTVVTTTSASVSARHATHMRS
jgi:hypothetical protein